MSAARAGLYARAVTGLADVMGGTHGLAGRVGMDTYGFGGYWTHRASSGWYADLVLQGNWSENVHATSVDGQSLDTQGWGLTASAETGYAIALGGAWSISAPHLMVGPISSGASITRRPMKSTAD